MGELPWGAHLCLFYETPQDLLDVHAGYFRAGLEGGELCLWALSEPITRDDAIKELRNRIRGFDRHLAAGHIELLSGHEWYLRGDDLDPQRITCRWHARLDEALVQGFVGMRVSGNAFWFETDLRNSFRGYEAEFDRSLEGRKMIVLCTYSLRSIRAVDMLDVARTHNFSLARRDGRWEFLETRELAEANREIRRLNSAIDILSKSFPGVDLLTPSERTVLGQIVKGASSKESARELRISPRTVEFHRANMMRKLGARNVAELLGKVLGTDGSR